MYYFKQKVTILIFIFFMGKKCNLSIYIYFGEIVSPPLCKGRCQNFSFDGGIVIDTVGQKSILFSQNLSARPQFSIFNFQFSISKSAYTTLTLSFKVFTPFTLTLRVVVPFSTPQIFSVSAELPEVIFAQFVFA